MAGAAADRGGRVARPIDSLDKTLIGLLGEDGRLSLADLDKRVGVSHPTAAARVRTLVGDGVLHIAGLVDAFQAKGLTVALATSPPVRLCAFPFRFWSVLGDSMC